MSKRKEIARTELDRTDKFAVTTTYVEVPDHRSATHLRAHYEVAVVATVRNDEVLQARQVGTLAEAVLMHRRFCQDLWNAEPTALATGVASEHFPEVKALFDAAVAAVRRIQEDLVAPPVVRTRRAMNLGREKP